MLKNFLKLIVQFLIWFFQPPVQKQTGSIVYPSLVEKPKPKRNMIDIKQYTFPENQYINETSEKNMIFLHHTVSPSDSSTGDIKWWLSNSERVGTHFIIDRFGNITQCVPLDKWIHHLYINAPSNRIDKKYRSYEHNVLINSKSIGIEIDSAGGLMLRNGRWISSYNKTIPKEDVYEIQYRGYKAFEKYHPAQIEAVKNLILYLCDIYPSIKESIKSDYSDIFDISIDALKGKTGIYTHTSVRTDKSDCVPQIPLIQMLNSLKDAL